MQHVFAVLFRLIIGNWISAVPIAMIASAIDITVVIDARPQRCRVRLVAYGRGVVFTGREFALFVTAAGFDDGVAMQQPQLFLCRRFI